MAGQHEISSTVASAETDSRLISQYPLSLLLYPQFGHSSHHRRSHLRQPPVRIFKSAQTAQIPSSRGQSAANVTMTVQPPLPSPSPAPSSSPTGPRTHLLTNLTTQTALLTQLFQSLSAPITTSAPSGPGGAFTGTNAGFGSSTNIPQLYAALQQTTSALQAQTEALWAHQRAWREMKRQEAEVRDLEGRVRGLVWELESGRAELEGLVQEGVVVRETIERLESGESRLEPVLLEGIAGVGLRCQRGFVDCIAAQDRAVALGANPLFSSPSLPPPFAGQH